MTQLCAKDCGQEVFCPVCDEARFNHPICVKYFNEQMPIIISTCSVCHVELFRTMTYEDKTPHKSFCATCIGNIETEAWQYRELCK